MSPRAHPRGGPAAHAGLLVLLALAVLVPGAAAGLLWLAPVLVLGLMLSLGRYPGETLVLRALACPRRRGASAISARLPSRVPPRRHGRLLAGSCAGRAPPAVPAVP